MKKETRPNIFIILGIVLFMLLMFFMIGSCLGNCELEWQITKDYKIKEDISTGGYNLYDSDDNRIVENIAIWIVFKGYIYGETYNKNKSYFIHDTTTKQTYTMKEMYKYHKLCSKLKLSTNMTLEDDLNNRIRNWHTHLYVSERKEFRKLSVELQVKTLLDKYINKKFIPDNQFYDYIDILMEKPDKSLPELFMCLKNAEVLPVSDLMSEYDVIKNILQPFYCWSELNDKYEDEYFNIYNNKLDKYLKKYKVIDERVQSIDAIIRKEHDVFGKSVLSKKELLKKYTDMGYKDLKIKKIGEE